MSFAEYGSYDATGLAELVHRREVKPVELVDAAIARIEARNPELNAVVHRSFERARAEAGALKVESSVPFLGVPFVLKDLMGEDAGQPSTSSCALLADWVARRDSELVSRFKRAGLLIVGRTNTPEFGILPVTEPQLRGPTRNPWDPGRTPGGSSGGSASAVASGMVPVGHAGDGGGSIRIPAACTGLVGLKPTRGRNPMGPDQGQRWMGFVSEHVVCRSVRDTARMLDAVAGVDVGAPYDLRPPQRPFAEELDREPGRLKIAFTPGTLFGGPTEAAYIRALEATVKILEELGHEVVEARPKFEVDKAVRAYLLVVSASAGQAVADAGRRANRTPKASDFEQSTWMLKVISDHLRMSDYQESLDYLGRLGRDVGRFFEDHDVMLTPTLAHAPVEIGEFDLSGSERFQSAVVRTARSRKLMMLALDAMAGRRMRATPNTQLFNLTGQPAISLPLHHDETTDLPIGMQFAGRFGDEATLLRLSAQIESAVPWAARQRRQAGAAV
jgi:amidase